MALLETTPYVVTSKWKETDFHTILGERWRWRYRVRAEWSCDDTGGESPPTTYSHPDSVDDLDIVSAEPQLSHGKPNGIYVAIYEGEGDWDY